MIDRRLFLAGAAGSALSTQAYAQAGQASLIFPFPAGSGGDTIARLVADGMSQRLGEKYIVDNRAGAGGRVGAMVVKGAQPDGRSLLMAPIALISIYPHSDPKLGYKPFEDFVPVSQIGIYDFCVGVGKNVPVKSVKELVEWVKADPKRGSYGSPGAGTLPHFFGVGFAKTAGVDMTHVVYRGTSDAIRDMVAGQLPIMFTTTSDLIQQAEAGEIKILATSGASSSSFIRNIPTFIQEGYKIEGTGWYGVYAPAGTPKPIVDKLAAAINETLKTELVQSRFKALGLVTSGTTPEELRRIQQADFDFWGPIVKASGFSMQ